MCVYVYQLYVEVLGCVDVCDHGAVFGLDPGVDGGVEQKGVAVGQRRVEPDGERERVERCIDRQI